jgi:hypothetical protein
MLALLLVISVGCNRRSAGPTVSEYEQTRTELAQKHPSGTARARPSPARQTPPPEPGQGLGGVGTSYAYDSTGKRDPFRSFILDRARELATTVERGPLEQFDLGQLALVAVIWGTDRARALVEDPSGRAYVVEEGGRIGKNDGEVVKIDDNLVAVRETYVDYLGDRTTKEIEMRIRQIQGG